MAGKAEKAVENRHHTSPRKAIAPQGFSPLEQEQIKRTARRALDRVQKKTSSTTQALSPPREGAEVSAEPVSEAVTISEELLVSGMPLQAESKNFKVFAADEVLGKIVLGELEENREHIAVELTGSPLKDWDSPCEVHVAVKRKQGGLTRTYRKEIPENALSDAVDLADLNEKFRKLVEPAKVEIAVFGNKQGLIDNVIPHEVTHAILRYHLQGNPPLWANEGIASFQEGDQMKTELRGNLIRAFSEGRAIPIDRLVEMDEYPRGREAQRNFYRHGMALSEFLIRNKGPREFVEVLQKVIREKARQADIGAADIFEKEISAKYGYANLEHLEKSLSKWVADGCPRITQSGGNKARSLPQRYLPEHTSNK